MSRPLTACDVSGLGSAAPSARDAPLVLGGWAALLTLGLLRRRRRALLGVAVAIGVLCVAGCSETRRAVATVDLRAVFNADLRCQMDAPATVTAGAPIPLRFALTNHGREELRVLPRSTPLAGALDNDILLVWRDGQRVAHGGWIADWFGPIPSESWIALAAGETTERTLDVARDYDFSTPGDYRIQFSGGLLDVTPDRAWRAAHDPTHRPLHHTIVACNAAAVHVVARVAPAEQK